MGDDDRKYLDPASNPFIPDPFKDDVELPAGTPGEDGLAPMLDLSLKPEDLAEKISQAFPGQNEITIAGTQLVKMATGNFTVNGQPLAQLPLATLQQLADLLKDKQKS